MILSIIINQELQILIFKLNINKFKKELKYYVNKHQIINMINLNNLINWFKIIIKIMSLDYLFNKDI